MDKEKYLDRNIDRALLEWKDNPRRKPLLLRGARQVGKSSSVRHLGKSFKYFLEVNVERNPEVVEFFQGSRDVRGIAAKLSDFFDVRVVPGETLLFLDEVQKSPDVIHSLWLFKDINVSGLRH